jgi:hypothetical protein
VANDSEALIAPQAKEAGAPANEPALAEKGTANNVRPDDQPTLF